MAGKGEESKRKAEEQSGATPKQTRTGYKWSTPPTGSIGFRRGDDLEALCEMMNGLLQVMLDEYKAAEDYLKQHHEQMDETELKDFYQKFKSYTSGYLNFIEREMLNPMDKWLEVPKNLGYISDGKGAIKMIKMLDYDPPEATFDKVSQRVTRVRRIVNGILSGTRMLKFEVEPKKRRDAIPQFQPTTPPEDATTEQIYGELSPAGQARRSIEEQQQSAGEAAKYQGKGKYKAPVQPTAVQKQPKSEPKKPKQASPVRPAPPPPKPTTQAWPLGKPSTSSCYAGPLLQTLERMDPKKDPSKNLTPLKKGVRQSKYFPGYDKRRKQEQAQQQQQPQQQKIRQQKAEPNALSFEQQLALAKQLSLEEVKSQKQSQKTQSRPDLTMSPDNSPPPSPSVGEDHLPGQPGFSWHQHRFEFRPEDIAVGYHGQLIEAITSMVEAVELMNQSLDEVVPQLSMDEVNGMAGEFIRFISRSSNNARVRLFIPLQQMLMEEQRYANFINENTDALDDLEEYLQHLRGLTISASSDKQAAVNQLQKLITNLKERLKEIIKKIYQVKSQ